MPTPRATNVVVFLDEVNEFNGPLMLVPGSHKEGSIDVSAQEGSPEGHQESPAWVSNLTANLKYSLDKGTMAELVERGGIVAPQGPAGSALFFNANVVHGSVPNMSQFDRAIVIVTYNSVENVPAPVEEPRPEFLASRDYDPVVPLPDGAPLA